MTGAFMKNDELKKQYDQITSLYDMAEELAATVEHKQMKNQEEQITLVDPLLNHVADAAEVLGEEYINILESKSRHKSAKSRIEKALRKIFTALEDYHRRVKEVSGGLAAALKNIADPIADRIYRQAEKIMLIFMQLIELSLERIMRKHELEEFRRANENFLRTQPQHGHLA
jgi:hypothetical protein